jgi:hypothetical protein
MAFIELIFSLSPGTVLPAKVAKNAFLSPLYELRLAQLITDFIHIFPLF